MHCNIRSIFSWTTALTLVVSIACSSAQSETIIKLGLGTDVAADIGYDGINLSTIADNNVPPTIGDQNTRVDFLGFLSGETDINTPIASFTLSDVAVSGPPVDVGNAGIIVIQNFTGGELFLYDPSNNLLLSGMLDDSVLSGSLGPPAATGAFFTTTFGMVTGGSLASQIAEDTLTLSISMTSVNNGQGFSISGAAAPVLDPFTADVTLNIAALPIPEPASLTLAMLSGLLMITWIVNCRSNERRALVRLPVQKPKRRS
jgi:hypothetical protein